MKCHAANSVINILVWVVLPMCVLITAADGQAAAAVANGSQDQSSIAGMNDADDGQDGSAGSVRQKRQFGQFGAAYVTVTELSTFFISSTTQVFASCAKLVNITGACRRRRGKWIEEPIIMSFDEGMDDLDQLLSPSAPLT